MTRRSRGAPASVPGASESGRPRVSVKSADTCAQPVRQSGDMKCTVITPVGPGHEQVAEACRDSVIAAIRNHRGLFDEIEHCVVDDTSAKLGRSAARNGAVWRAAEAGSDWVFFLDADDLICVDAFERVSPWISGYDAIWGAICEQRVESDDWRLRERQDLPITNLLEFLEFDPFYALQMGHFVRTSVARDNPFNPQMNAGEDFDYYLRIWTRYRCLKIGAPLFINRRWQHSTGPRSASGHDWSRAIRRLRARYLMDNRRELRVLLRNRPGGVTRRDKWRLRRWQVTLVGAAWMRLRAWRPRRSAARR